ASPDEGLKGPGVEQSLEQQALAPPIRRFQQSPDEATRLPDAQPLTGPAAVASAAARMEHRANAVEQTRLVGTAGNPASEQPRDRPARDMRGRKRATCYTEHREVGLPVADGERVDAAPADHPEQRQQSSPLVGLPGHDRAGQ